METLNKMKQTCENAKYSSMPNKSMQQYFCDQVSHSISMYSSLILPLEPQFKLVNNLMVNKIIKSVSKLVNKPFCSPSILNFSSNQPTNQ